jgi:hypothetical protein
MSYTPYRVLALISPEVKWEFTQVIDAIRGAYDRMHIPVQIDQGEKRCILRFDDWTFRIYWEDEPHVLLESQEMAWKFPTKAIDPSVIASCSRRITTGGDSDSDMMHFNDYVHVLEVLESFEGVYLFDPDDGKFLESGEKQS